jgi:hypothetical protein
MVACEVLSSPPISGTVDEVHFSAFGDCTWVRFTGEDDWSWCGVFGPGCLPAKRTAVANADGRCFVIASGQGYLVDARSREVLHKTQNDWLVSAIAIPGRDVFVACTYWELLAYRPVGRVWRSRRISIDGIKLLKASNSQLAGQVWNLETWVDFVLDLDGWTYRSEFKCAWD